MSIAIPGIAMNYPSKIPRGPNGSRGGSVISEQMRCTACDHVGPLTPEALLVRLGGNRAAKVLDLNDRFRCRGCGRKERAVVWIKWRQRG
jgi:hypothetical protein